MAGATSVGIIFHPLRSATVPGSGASAAMMTAASISKRRNTPNCFNFSINFKGTWCTKNLNEKMK